MQLRISKRSAESSRKKRQTFARSAASTTTYGSMASVFFALILSPNSCSSAARISAGVIFHSQSFRPARRGRLGRRLRFGRGSQLFVLLGKCVLFFGGLLGIGIAELGGQQYEAGPRRYGNVERLLLGQVLHAADLVLNPHQAFKERFRPRRAAGNVNIYWH